MHISKLSFFSFLNTNKILKENQSKVKKKKNQSPFQIGLLHSMSFFVVVSNAQEHRPRATNVIY